MMSLELEQIWKIQGELKTANGKISFTNTAGNPEDYSFVKNFDWNYTNDLEVNKTVNNSQSGVIKVTKIFEIGRAHV